MLAVFGLGPIELILVGLIVLGCVAAVGVMRKKTGGKLRGCPHCGQAVPEFVTTCPKCGRPC